MKALDISMHKANMTNILIDIFKDTDLAGKLGFKGGTAAMLFYGLPRFSTDLDFDLITNFKKEDTKKDFIRKIDKLLGNKYEIKDKSDKHNTLFWQVSYGSGLSRIKIEISTRENPLNKYDLKLFYGTEIQVLKLQDMMAHKLVALTERKSLANRDLFDIHFFLGLPEVASINYGIVELRTSKKIKDFLKELLVFMDSVNNNKILEGLGEVLTEPQKDWVKAKLLTETKGLIERQIDLFTSVGGFGLDGQN